MIDISPPEGVTLNDLSIFKQAEAITRKATKNLVATAPKKEKLPERCSLRDKMPPVYLQKYGSCTTNAVMCIDHYMYHKVNKEWRPSCTFTYFNQLCMQEDLKIPKADTGSANYWALVCAKKYGACDAKVWPNEQPWNKKPSKAAYADGLKGKEFKKWRVCKDMYELKRAIYHGRPVTVSFNWCFKGAEMRDGKCCMIKPTKKEIDTCTRGHALCAIGYDDKLKLIEIRNSWGEDWCDAGHIWVDYETFNKINGYWESFEVLE